MIRPYRPEDLAVLKHITAVCFPGVSIDHNIEQRFGLIGGRDWQFRKLRHIDDDVAGERASGVFCVGGRQRGRRLHHHPYRPRE